MPMLYTRGKMVEYRATKPPRKGVVAVIVLFSIVWLISLAVHMFSYMN